LFRGNLTRVEVRGMGYAGDEKVALYHFDINGRGNGV